MMWNYFDIWPVVQKMSLKDSYLEIWRPSCSLEGKNYAILKEVIMVNIQMKLFEIFDQ